jgi:uncharacterized damage-inducible protein DinB
VSRIEHIRLMANYNTWMNDRLYDEARKLPVDELMIDRKAFFGSIFATLNHIAVADTLWLRRFATHPANYPALQMAQAWPTPKSLGSPLFDDIGRLSSHRQVLDQTITDWAASIEEHELDHLLTYTNSRGVVSSKPFFGLVMHFFNHQTHHRGQATTLFSQCGVDVGVTDLLAIIPNAE